jgi:CheY-like chemotaxis protein
MNNESTLSGYALIIEDDALYGMMYRHCLTELAPELDLIEVSNGYSALAQMANQTPRLVVLDLHMPALGGHEFLGIVKSKPQYRSLPMVIISSARESVLASLQTLPTVQIHRKPISATAFKQVAARLLGTPDPVAEDQEMPPGKSSDLEKFLGPDPRLQREFAQIFFDIVPDRIAELVYCIDRAHTDPRHTRLSEWCHAMRGTASIIGAPTLGQLVETLASAYKTGSIDVIRDIAAQTTHELRSIAIDMDQQFNLTQVETG